MQRKTFRIVVKAGGSPSYRPSVARDSTLYSSLLMPPLFDTKPTDPGRYSLQAMMLSRVPAVSPMRNAPALAASWLWQARVEADQVGLHGERESRGFCSEWGLVQVDAHLPPPQ
jgi:hypothetical protein